MLKLMDVAAFPVSFRKSDLLSQRWPGWARLDPGVELLAGLGVLLRPELPAVARLIGAMGLLLGATGMVPVSQSMPPDCLACTPSYCGARILIAITSRIFRLVGAGRCQLPPP